ncbi:MAG: ATP-grasp domain-containing protein [Candidatus Aureabacteria bacterium]|nr:ATP-grasp domain-containing protein [Candidatus Auribacterota bacterium]
MSDILMMIGAGVMQSPAIEAAKDAGYRIVSVDGAIDPIGRKISDFFINEDISDWEKVVAASKNFSKKISPIGGVITVGTDFSYTVAKVCDALSLVGVSPETALAATNKGVMRKRFKEFGVPSPDFRIVKTLEEADIAVKELGFPCVVKPVDNMGARGVSMIKKEASLKIAFENAVEGSSSKQVIIEEFMEGPELSMDTIVYDGSVYMLTVADRIISGEPYFIERGHTIPSQLKPDTIEDVFRVMKLGIEALGINIGASKVDMKVTPKGPMIGEMTVRLSGGFHSQYTDPLATGMRSMKAAIDIAMGKKLNIEDVTPEFEKAACERSLYPKSGKVVEINGVEDALKMKGIYKIFLNTSIGKYLNPVTSNMGKACHIIAFGDTRSEAIENCKNAMKKINIVTVMK